MTGPAMTGSSVSGVIPNDQRGKLVDPPDARARVLPAASCAQRKGRTRRANGARRAGTVRTSVVEHRGKLWGELTEDESNIVVARVGVIAREIMRTGRSAETGETLH